MLNVDSPVTNGTATEDVKTDNGAAFVSGLSDKAINAIADVLRDEKTRVPFHNTGLADDIVAALTKHDDTVTIATATYQSARKNGRTITVKLAVGQADGWTPVFTADSTHKIARGKETEYTRILRDACTVRGGTVLAVSIGYKVDSLGFKVYDPNPVRAGLDKAFFQLPDEDRRRVDTDYLILANDQQADDFADVAGYFLVKIRGYRVK